MVWPPFLYVKMSPGLWVAVSGEGASPEPPPTVLLLLRLSVTTAVSGEGACRALRTRHYPIIRRHTSRLGASRAPFCLRSSDRVRNGTLP